MVKETEKRVKRRWRDKLPKDFSFQRPPEHTLGHFDQDLAEVTGEEAKRLADSPGAMASDLSWIVWSLGLPRSRRERRLLLSYKDEFLMTFRIAVKLRSDCPMDVGVLERCLNLYDSNTAERETLIAARRQLKMELITVVAWRHALSGSHGEGTHQYDMRRWIYDQCCDLSQSLGDIRIKMKAKGLVVPRTTDAIRKRAIRFAEKNGLPRPPERR